MKTSITLLLWLALFRVACAQPALKRADVIYKRDNTHLEVEITEVTSHEIRYRPVANLTGPVHILLKDEVSVIVYANGYSEAMPLPQVPGTTIRPPVPASVSSPSVAAAAVPEPVVARAPRLLWYGGVILLAPLQAGNGWAFGTGGGLICDIGHTMGLGIDLQNNYYLIDADYDLSLTTYVALARGVLPLTRPAPSEKLIRSVYLTGGAGYGVAEVGVGPYGTVSTGSAAFSIGLGWRALSAELSSLGEMSGISVRFSPVF